MEIIVRKVNETVYNRTEKSLEDFDESTTNYVLESQLPNPFELEGYATKGMTVPQHLLMKAKYWADQGKDKWIIDTETAEYNTFRQFEDKTRRIASSLYKRGMRHGDGVIYMTLDLVNLHVVLTGIWRANGWARATYPEENKETLLGRVKESNVGWIICDPIAAKMCLSVASEVSWPLEVIVVGVADGCTSLAELFQDDGSDIPEFTLTPSDTAIIFCTSGTSGGAKGAVHTHKTLMNTIAAQNFAVTRIPLPPDSSKLFICKGTHISGTVLPLSMLASGSTALVMANVSQKAVLKAVDVFKPSLVYGFPTFLLGLVNDPEAGNYDRSSIGIVASGGAPLIASVRNPLMQLPNIQFIINLYGLTEAVPIAMNLSPVKNGVRVEGSPELTVGKVFPGLKVQIVDLISQKSLGPLQHGEILVKGSNMFNSYYKDIQATQEAFLNGWYRTGDVGYYDEAGFIFVVDRIKDIFKYWNNHISPSELEDVISRHEVVAECCVVGVPDPNGGGSIPRAFVTVKHNCECDAKEIRRFAEDRLPSYKHLQGGLHIISEFPVGMTGKITRQLVSQLQVRNGDDINGILFEY